MRIVLACGQVFICCSATDPAPCVRAGLGFPLFCNQSGQRCNGDADDDDGHDDGDGDDGNGDVDGEGDGDDE